MYKSGAGTWALTLGVVSLLTFFVGLAMGYALFSPNGTYLNLEVVERVDLTAEANKPKEDIRPSTMLPDSTPSAEPVKTLAEPDVVVAKDSSDATTFHAARHLFIAVNGQWLAEGTKTFLKDLQPGGVVLRARNVVSEEQTRALVNEIKSSVGIGTEYYDLPMIALSQEGGSHNVLRVPDAMNAVDLSMGEDTFESQRLGKLYGETAKAFGVNVVFGPMLDVYNETTAFPDMAPRSFGSNQNQVALQGLAMAKGLRSSGVIPVAKHFPGYAFSGYGADGTSVVINTEFSELARAIYPFREAINNAIEGMIVGHVAVPMLDKDFPNRPAALSPVLVSELLRNRWGYEGVIIADEMAFNEMTRAYPVERAVVEALKAGCDAVIFLDPSPRQINAVVEAIDRAVASGELSSEELAVSQLRLEKWRFALGAEAEVEPELNTQMAKVPDAPVGTPMPIPVAPPTAPTPEPVTAVKAEMPAPSETPVAPKPSTVIVPTPVPVEIPKTDMPTPEVPAPKVPKVDMPTPEVPKAPEEIKVDTPPMPKPDEVKAETSAKEVTTAPVAEVKSDTPMKKEETPKVSESIEALVVAVDESSLKKVVHTVVEGETLLQIAWDYDVKSEDIIRWNKLDSMTVETGSHLDIYIEASPEEKKMAKAEIEPEPDPKQADMPEAPAPAKEEMPESETATTPEAAPKETPKPEPVPTPEPMPKEEPKPEPVPTPGSMPKEEPKPETKPEPVPAPEPMPKEEPKPDATPESTPAPAPAEEPKPEPSTAPEEKPATDTKIKLVHQVVYGETLESIAQLYKVSAKDIKKWNTLEDDTVKANSSLLIYLASKEALKNLDIEVVNPLPPAPKNEPGYYVVQLGDTMSKIVREHNTKLDIILELNKLDDPNNIRVGQKLKVPAAK